jgi:hypothetical protein
VEGGNLSTMRPVSTIWLIGMTGLWLCACNGGGDSHKAAAADFLAVHMKLCKVLEGIRTEANAQAAAEEILALAAELDEVVDRQKALGDPTPAEDDALSREYVDRLKAANLRIKKSMERLHGDPRIWSFIGKPMKAFHVARPR